MSFEIKQGSRGPALNATLTKGDGTPQDLTGGTVLFYMKRNRTGTLKVTGGAVSIVGAPTAGVVQYNWGANDTDTPGMYTGEFEVTGLSPTPSRFPSGKPLDIYVVPKV